MPPVYFISDVHLGCGRPDEERIKIERLLRLFEEVRSAKGSLIILGDLFDFWFEYRHVLPKGHHRILAALEKLSESGVEITCFAGNHDFALGRYFSIELGLKVVQEELQTTLNGKHFYLHHGDGLAVKDNGYRFLKKILRNRIAQFVFRWLHPDLGFGLARMLSHKSREFTSYKDYGAEDGMRNHAIAQLRKGADFVVMGHRHIPWKEECEHGWYILLGDWISHFSYGIFEEDALNLMTLRNDIPEPLVL